MIWLFFAVLIICVTYLVSQHRTLAREQWDWKASHEFLKEQLAATQKVAKDAHDRAGSVLSRVNLEMAPKGSKK